MITKTIHVNKPFTFKGILKGINQTVEDDFVKRLRVDNDFINYTIINAKGDEYAEITFTLEEDYNCVVLKLNGGFIFCFGNGSFSNLTSKIVTFSLINITPLIDLN